MFKNVFLFSAILFLRISIFPGVAVSQPTEQEKIQVAIERFVNKEAIRSASVGVCILKISSGKTLGSLNKEKLLVPASVVKMITTMAALDNLGSDFQFSTQLLVESKDSLKAGVLHGNLFLSGSGDPTLGSSRFPGYGSAEMAASLARQLSQNGIKEIRGNLVSLTGTNDQIPQAPTWQLNDVGNYYAPGIFRLNYAENSYTLEIKPGKLPGEKATLADVPPFLDLTFHNELLTGKKGSGDNAIIYSMALLNEAWLRGTVPAGVSTFTIKGAVPNPPLFAGKNLMDLLAKEGIRFSQGEVESIPDAKNLVPIASWNSPPLNEVVYQTNHFSINLFAEALLKAIGESDATGHYSYPKTLENWLEAGGSGRAWLADGCGLSRNNLMSAEVLCRALMLAPQKTWFTDFLNSLPYSGENESGSMNRLFFAQKRWPVIRAKSGYMTGIRTWSGYLIKDGTPTFSFAIMVNNCPENPAAVRQAIARLLTEIAEILSADMIEKP